MKCNADVKDDRDRYRAALERINANPCAKAILSEYCYERDEPSPCSSCIARLALAERGEEGDGR